MGSTTSNGGKVDLWTSVGIRQKWNLVKAGKGYYHIMLSFGVEGRGLRLDDSYLSVTPNGQKVDVYGKDDASGRQRWKIIKQSGYFNIMIIGGVSGKRKYLSTTTSGNKVDLWIKDDGSGRQRWVIPHALISTPKPTPRPTPRPTPVPVRNLVSGGGWKIVKGVRKCTISIENGVKFPCAVVTDMMMMINIIQVEPMQQRQETSSNNFGQSKLSKTLLARSGMRNQNEKDE